MTKKRSEENSLTTLSLKKANIKIPNGQEDSTIRNIIPKSPQIYDSVLKRNKISVINLPSDQNLRSNTIKNINFTKKITDLKKERRGTIQKLDISANMGVLNPNINPSQKYIDLMKMHNDKNLNKSPCNESNEK